MQCLHISAQRLDDDDRKGTEPDHYNQIFLEERKEGQEVYGQPATIYAGCVILEKSAVLVCQKES